MFHANLLWTNCDFSQVAQRQQQQRQQQLQQQTTGVTPTKTYSNAKQKQTIVAIKKVQRLNGAKVVVANNGEKAESKDTDSNNSLTPSQQQTQLAIASITAPTTCGETNHQPTNQLRIIRPNQVQQQTILASSSPPNSSKRITVPTAVGEDSDSTNNSLASSSGIGGSRDCSGVGAEEENSLTSFEGILLNGVPSNLEIDTQEDGSSKDSTSVGSKEKLSQGMMLADLLERKVEKEPIMNGVLGKKDIVENHIKKVRKYFLMSKFYFIFSKFSIPELSLNFQIDQNVKTYKTPFLLASQLNSILIFPK